MKDCASVHHANMAMVMDEMKGQKVIFNLSNSGA